MKKKPFTIGISAKMLKGGMIPPGEAAFPDEIAEWCQSELKHPYTVQYVTFANRMDVFKPVEVTFGDDQDAILFKLRWC